LDVAVGQVERLTMRNPENAGSGLGFRGSLLGSPAGSGFPAREIKNPGTPAERLLDQQGASAGLLDVITMGSDGKDVERT
jgi:hypothetical protein